VGKAVRVFAYYGIAIRPPYENYPSSKLWKWARVKEHIIWLVYTLTREYFNIQLIRYHPGNQKSQANFWPGPNLPGPKPQQHSRPLETITLLIVLLAG